MRWTPYVVIAAALLWAAGCTPREETPPAGGAAHNPEGAPVANTPGAQAHSADDGHGHAPGEGHADEAKPADAKAPAGEPATTSTAAPTKIDPSKFKRLPSGLRYAVIKPGDGMTATAGKGVTVHYTGWLKDGGKKFDSSVDSGRPFEFPLGVGRVIKGWDEGVAGMKVGEKRQLIIPAEMGYGASGFPPDIPPGATLVFDVELLGVG